jgi:ABC-type antimicrobial peptide transport system permease subunit
VLNYSVLQRRREIGIRMALGAPRVPVARLVAVDVFRMVVAGSIAGLALGIGSARYIESLLYQVKAVEPKLLTLPALAILVVTLLATLPAVVRALRIEPAEILRAE